MARSSASALLRKRNFTNNSKVSCLRLRLERISNASFRSSIPPCNNRIHHRMTWRPSRLRPIPDCPVHYWSACLRPRGWRWHGANRLWVSTTFKLTSTLVAWDYKIAFFHALALSSAVVTPVCIIAFRPPIGTTLQERSTMPQVRRLTKLL